MKDLELKQVCPKCNEHIKAKLMWRRNHNGFAPHVFFVCEKCSVSSGHELVDTRGIRQMWYEDFCEEVNKT